MTQPPAVLPKSPQPLRVVFFGRPRSGKTDLLARVIRLVGQNAEEAPVELVHAPHTPEQLAVRQELIPHQILVDLSDDNTKAQKLIFFDCDGLAASELLNAPDALRKARARTALLSAIQEADALVLVIDAGWKLEAVEDVFADFRQFLDAFNAGRSYRREVGGLPVILALTKCDLLYDRGLDDASNWFRRIDMRLHELKRQFEDYFETTTEADFAEFGGLELKLAATAKELPPPPGFQLYDDGTGGFGAQELAELILDTASAYRKRSIRAGKRLKWTAIGAVGLFTTMLVVLLGLAWFAEPGPVEVLSRRIEAYKATEGEPEVRLSDKHRTGNTRELNDIRQSEYFDHLKPDLKKFVEYRIREQEAYSEYRRRFEPPQRTPANLLTREQLDQLQQDVNTKLQPPPEFATTWEQTQAVQLVRKWKDDLGRFQRAEEQLHDWYRNQIKRATAFMLIDVPTKQWAEQVDSLLTKEPPPFGRDQPIESSPTISGLRAVNPRLGNALTYSSVFYFDRTAAAQADWESVAEQLADLRDLCLAVGLTPDLNPPVLVLPEPTDTEESLRLAGERLTQLKLQFPRVADGKAHNNFPNPIRTELVRKLRTCTETGIRHVHRLILREISIPKTRGDRPTDWAILPAGLLSRRELSEWGRFLELLQRWSADDPEKVTDPVEELRAFLKQKAIEAKFDQVEVYLPNNLGGSGKTLTPEGVFAVAFQGKDGQPKSLEFKQEGSGTESERGMKYVFKAVDKNATLYAQPGEPINAGLTLKSDAGQFQLSWTTSRTSTYFVERLTREARLKKVGSTLDAQPVVGVTLTWYPHAKAIRVPELLPETK